MRERVIKHWITSLIGLVIILAGVIVFILAKVNQWNFSGWELVPVVLLGYLLFMSKDTLIRNIARFTLTKHNDKSIDNIDRPHIP